MEKVKFEITTSTIIKIIVALAAVWFIFVIRDIVLLFFIVIAIVSALGPIVDFLAKIMPRLLAMIIISVIFIGIVVTIGFLLIPPLIGQIQQLAINLPDYVTRMSPYYQNFKVAITSSQQSLYEFSSQLGNITGGIYSTTIGFVTTIVAILTVLVLSFYMLLEQDAIKHFFHQVFPVEHKDRAVEVVRKIGFKMGGWLRGQVLLMVTIGILEGIALASLGVPYALTLAVWGGLIEVVPYIGPWLGLLPAAAIAFSISPLKALLVIIIYIVIEQIESNIMVPKIMGRAVGLSPVIIILALLIGAKLAGLLGVFVAVPVAAALSVIVQEWSEIRKIWENG
jgi:predicted PurR-regulated permease PerM